VNSARSFSRAQQEVLDRLSAAVDGLESGDLAGAERRHRLLIHLREHRGHQEPGHHQRQSHQGGVGGSGLRAQRLAQEVKDHQQPDHRRHGHQDGGQKRDQGKDKENRPRR